MFSMKKRILTLESLELEMDGEVNVKESFLRRASPRQGRHTNSLELQHMTAAFPWVDLHLSSSTHCVAGPYVGLSTSSTRHAMPITVGSACGLRVRPPSLYSLNTKIKLLRCIGHARRLLFRYRLAKMFLALTAAKPGACDSSMQT